MPEGGGKGGASADGRDVAAVLLKRGYSGVKKIGEGAFGVALLVENSDGGKMVAKMVDVSRAKPKETNEARREARLLAQLKHPYIVRYRENFAEKGWLCIVMDFCDGGDVTGRIEKAVADKTSLEEQLVLRWVTQGLLALKYLHGKHILHRDLKPSNLFLTIKDDLRMGDFGMSKVLQDTIDQANTFVGTPYYLSPEVVQETGYNSPADIWSFGCILYHLCALQVPFPAQNMFDLTQKICGSAIPAVPELYSEPLRNICRDMMKRNVQDRPSADELINRTLIQNAVKSLLAEAKTEDGDKNKGRIQQEVRDQFTQFDCNRDGIIDRQELGQVLRHIDATVWTEQKIDEVLKVADTNQDGKIQFDEFLHWVFGDGKDAQAGAGRRVKELAEKARRHAASLDKLKDALIEWRQVIDLGCLRVCAPEVAKGACDAVADIAKEAGALLEGADDPAASYEAARQLRAVLQVTEQLLEEATRPLVRRVACLDGGEVPAVRALCFELVDGARAGQSPGGLNDTALQASGARWEDIAEGERIIEVKGIAHGGAETAPKQDALARRVVLRTNRGRDLNIGDPTVESQGAPFSFAAPEGEEIIEAMFAAGTCRGIRTARAPVAWPVDAAKEVESAFRTAAQAAWPILLRLSWRMGPRVGRHALLEARRIGIAAQVPAEVSAEQREGTTGAKPPSHWDLAAMKGADPSSGSLAPDVGPGQVPLAESSLKSLQAVISASYGLGGGAGNSTSTNGGAGVVAPDDIQLVRGVRLQHWRSWSAFAARCAEISQDWKSESQSAGEPFAADPALAPHFSALKSEVEIDSNGAWLFHGLDATASGVVEELDFDIDRVASEASRLYGRGVYLTEACSTVDRHAPEAGTGGDLRCLLLCRVALGRFLKDDALLPDVVNLVSQCTKGSYHSVIGDRSARISRAPRDFVVYDRDQVYPEYLLWYRRIYR